MFFSFKIQGFAKNLITVGPSFLWSCCSQAGCLILRREKKSQNFIWYSLRKVYLKILHCRLWRISTNALTHVTYNLQYSLYLNIGQMLDKNPFDSKDNGNDCVLRLVNYFNLLVLSSISFHPSQLFSFFTQIRFYLVHIWMSDKKFKVLLKGWSNVILKI